MATLSLKERFSVVLGLHRGPEQSWYLVRGQQGLIPPTRQALKSLENPDSQKKDTQTEKRIPSLDGVFI